MVSPAASLVAYEVLGHSDDFDIVEQPPERLAAGVADTVDPIELEMVTCSKFEGVAPDTLPAGGTDATEVPLGSKNVVDIGPDVPLVGVGLVELTAWPS